MAWYFIVLMKNEIYQQSELPTHYTSKWVNSLCIESGKKGVPIIKKQLQLFPRSRADQKACQAMKAKWANMHLRSIFCRCLGNSGDVWASTLALLIQQSHPLIIDCSGPWWQNPTGGLQTDFSLVVLNLYISIYTGTVYSRHVLLPLHFESLNRKEKQRDEGESQRSEKVKFAQSSHSDFLEQTRELVQASSLLIHFPLRAFIQLLLLFWVTGVILHHVLKWDMLLISQGGHICWFYQN